MLAAFGFQYIFFGYYDVIYIFAINHLLEIYDRLVIDSLKKRISLLYSFILSVVFIWFCYCELIYSVFFFSNI